MNILLFFVRIKIMINFTPKVFDMLKDLHYKNTDLYITFYSFSRFDFQNLIFEISDFNPFMFFIRIFALFIYFLVISKKIS